MGGEREGNRSRPTPASGRGWGGAREKATGPDLLLPRVGGGGEREKTTGPDLLLPRVGGGGGEKTTGPDLLLPRVGGGGRERRQQVQTYSCLG